MVSLCADQTAKFYDPFKPINWIRRSFVLLVGVVCRHEFGATKLGLLHWLERAFVNRSTGTSWEGQKRRWASCTLVSACSMNTPSYTFIICVYHRPPMIESMVDGRSIRRSLSRNRQPTLHHLHIVKFTMWKSTWRRGALNMPSSRWFALNFTFDVVHRSHNSFMMLENSESVHLNFDEVTSKSSVAVTAVTYWWQCYPPSICVTQRLLLKRLKIFSQSFNKISLTR